MFVKLIDLFIFSYYFMSVYSYSFAFAFDILFNFLFRPKLKKTVLYLINLNI